MIHISEDKLLIFTLLILMTVVDSEMNTFTGHEGRKVKIKCPYDAKFEKMEKYLCRGKCSIGYKDIPVESGSEPKDKRFSLTDNRTAHIFTITITDLRTADQGKYWCAVKTRLGKFDDYKEIYLEIKQVSRVSGEPGKHLNITCSYTRDLKELIRFLCKGSDPSDCKKMIKVSSETNTTGRFSLTDDSERNFTVNIRDLTEEDSGIYWCGAEEKQTRKHTWISATDLQISEATSERRLPKNTTAASFHTSKPEDPASSRPVTPSSSASSSSISMFLNASTNAASSNTPLGFTAFIMLMVVVMLTVFGLSLFLYLKRKQKKKGAQTKDGVYYQPENLPNGNTETTREATHGVSDYEEISSSLNNPIYSSVSPAFSKQDASVYAVAQLPSSPSDHLNYSTVRFSASHHSDRTSGGLDTCDYATVNV